MRSSKNSAATFLGLLIFTSVKLASAQAVPGCGNLQSQGQFGPFDYYDPEAKGVSLSLVEGRHFTPEVEQLVRGKTSVSPIEDLDYTLRAFPNHPRALNAVARWALQGGSFQTAMVPSADCYFRRAIAFRPEDAIAHMLFGTYLWKRGKDSEAAIQYEEAFRLAPTSAEVNYNAGLFFLKQGDLARAKKHAEVAYAGGYPLPGLRNKIAAAESKAAR